MSYKVYTIINPIEVSFNLSMPANEQSRVKNFNKVYTFVSPWKNLRLVNDKEGG